jgi:two-component system LytT family response regulator
MELTAVIVEDERMGLINLRNMLGAHCPQVAIIGEADGVESGFALLRREDIQPDVVFLDINLSDGKAFQLLERLRPADFDIIFVTAYDQFAMKACAYSSIGYILKPIDPDLLVEAVSRVHSREKARTDERLALLEQYRQHPNRMELMSIAGVDSIHFVKARNIVRLEAEDNYTHIYLTSGQRVTASKTIKLYETLLAPFNFYRVHKRHLINMNFMAKFVKGEGGYLVMQDGTRIEVSRRRRPAFLDRLRGLQ